MKVIIRQIKMQVSVFQLPMHNLEQSWENEESMENTNQ